MPSLKYHFIVVNGSAFPESCSPFADTKRRSRKGCVVLRTTVFGDLGAPADESANNVVLLLAFCWLGMTEWILIVVPI